MSTIKTRKYKDSVYIIYTHKLNIFKIYTGGRIEDRYWNIESPRKNYPDSTIHRHVKALKAFFRFTYPDKNISFMKYSMLTTDEEIIALTEAELTKLIEADLTGHLNKTRDLFVFCTLTGMRHSDSQAFNPSWVTSEQILEFKQAKTGGKASNATGFRFCCHFSYSPFLPRL